MKRLIAKLPEWIQEELKRIHFAIQIKRGAFVTDEFEFNDLSLHVKSGTIAIDVGANIGHYTLKLSELVGTNGRVIAFEPMAQTFAHLATNMDKRDNVTLINAAASDKTCILKMDVPSFNTGLKNYYMASISDDAKTSIMGLSIDDMNIPEKVSLIKMDAEGHEDNVIQGALNLIKRDKPVLIIEAVSDESKAILLDIGYSEYQHRSSHNSVLL